MTYHLYWTFKVVFDVGLNQLTGGLPTGIFQATNLEHLSIGGNADVSGSISPGFSNFTSLKALDLGLSRFSGTLPPFLFDFVELTSLALGGARFSGTLSDDFAKLDRLSELYLNNYTFSGEIPAGFDALTRLSELILRVCSVCASQI